MVIDVTLEGSGVLEHTPRKLPDLFAGTPLIVAIRSRPEGGEVVVRGRLASGPWESRVRVPTTQPGEGSQAVVALFGREAVEDLDAGHVLDGHRRGPSVDPREPTKRVRMPHALPDGLSAEGLGLRGAIFGAAGATAGRAIEVSYLAAGPSAIASRTRLIDLLRVPLGRAPSRPSPKGQRAAETRGAERRIHARVIAGRAGKIIVETLVEGGDLDWVPPARANVEWHDGVVTTLALHLALSTRGGIAKDGDSFRVVLLGELVRESPVRIELACGPVHLVLDF